LGRSQLFQKGIDVAGFLMLGGLLMDILVDLDSNVLLSDVLFFVLGHLHLQLFHQVLNIMLFTSVA